MRLLKNRIKILGHRGYRGKYPENTLLAFQKAYEAGAHGVEFDVQKTADGQFVVIHDEDVDRTTGGTGLIENMNYNALSKLDAGQGEKIPLLEEVLAMSSPGALVNIELKDETLRVQDAGPIMDLIEPVKEKLEILVSSFEHSLLPPYREAGFTIGMLIGEQHQAWGLSGIIKAILRLKPDYLNLPVDLFKHLPGRLVVLLVRTAKLFGMGIAFWTVNSPAEVNKVKAIADVIITDEVELVCNIFSSSTSKNIDT